MATSIVIPQKEIDELKENGLVVQSELRAIKVVDPDTCEMASSALQRRAEWKARVVERFQPLKETAFKLHKMICNMETEVLATGEADAQVTRVNRDKYLRDVEIARKQREDQKIKEQRALEEQQRKEAAERAKDMGASKAAVKQILNEPISMPAPVVEAAPLPENTYKRTIWKWRPEISEEKTIQAIVKAIAKSKDPNYNKVLIGYLQLNEKALQGDATKKQKLAAVPGVVFYPQDSYIDKAAR